MIKVIEAEQRSEAWFAARAGLLTGSRASDAFAKLKSGGESASRRDYKLQLAVERLTGKPIESGFINAEMQRGIDVEPLARSRYEAASGNLVRQTGFVIGDNPYTGCSLDGDIDEFAGIVEFKCPKSTTHIRYLEARELPADYRLQVTHNLWVTGAQWCDFCSFDDRLPAGLDWFCVRVHATDLNLSGYAADAAQFLAEVSVEVAKLTSLRTAA
jgi:predicted phage-related endonuclease